MASATKIGEAFVEVTTRGFGRVFSQVEQMKASIATIGAGALVVGAGIERFFGQPVRQAMIESSKAAASSEEAFNRLKIAFGDNIPVIQSWAREFGDATGLQARGLAEATGELGLMLGAMGFTKRQSAELSTTMTTLAVDMASVAEIPLEEAFLKLRAGIAGESEPLRRLGVDITENRLKQEALARGINKSVAEMSLQEKAMLRMQAIFSQTGEMQGDAANTAGSFSNTVKQLGEAVVELRKSFGAMVNDAAKPFIAALKVLSDWGAKFIKVLMFLPGPIRTFLVGMIAVASIMGVVLMIAGAVALAFVSLSAAAVLLGGSVLFVAKAIAVLVLSIPVLGLLLVLLSGIFSLFVSGSGDTSEMMEGMEDQLKRISDETREADKAMKGFGKSSFEAGSILKGFITRGLALPSIQIEGRSDSKQNALLASSQKQEKLLADINRSVAKRPGFLARYASPIWRLLS